jgi:hypothetical protein
VQPRYTYIEAGSRGGGVEADWQNKKGEGGAAGGY